MSKFTAEWFKENGVPEGSVWQRGRFMQICFDSCGCRFKEQGKCYVCNYGSGGKKVDVDDAISLIEKAIDFENLPDILLLGTNGSILDEQEMDRWVLGHILDRVSELPIPTIYLETHYSTIDSVSLKFVKDHLPGKKIIIEMGLESSNPYILKVHLNRQTDMRAYENTVSLINYNGLEVSFNVLLGIPGLRTSFQVRDAVETIKWAYAMRADDIVVFPVNVKPETKLFQMVRTKREPRISNWLAVTLFQFLSDGELSRVSISWFGDRQFAGICKHIYPPTSCYDCEKELQIFYQEFMMSHDVGYRRELLAGFVEKTLSYGSCDCYMKVMNSIDPKIVGRKPVLNLN